MSGARRRLPAPALFVVSGICQYLGAAVAIGLMSRVPSATVAWLRVVLAALVLVAWQRPWRRRWTGRALVDAAVFGTVLAGMNVAFYLAIATLPLGTAVTLEFIGPVAVGALTGRSARERWAIVVGAGGVVLLAGASLRLGAAARGGLVAIAVAAVLWAGYILLGRRVARAAGSADLTGLSVAMAAGAVVFSPLAVHAGPVLGSPRLALAAVGVAVLSSVVPYSIEQVVMRAMAPATFAVLLAILPATAVAVGAVVLHQLPSWSELGGLVLVSAAIVLTAPARRADDGPAPD